MVWDAANSSMTMPVHDSRVLTAGYMCWFNDHSIQLVPEDTLRLCVVSTAASENIQALTPTAILVIATYTSLGVMLCPRV